MRIFTCTPVAFGGGEDFFARDSGLLCRGLQSIGVESMAVMPGERKSEDGEDLIRTKYGNLESSDWWRTHKLDAVVLYAWGRPKFRNVARAILRAGIFLILNQDNGGLISPLVSFPRWLSEQWIMTGKGRGALPLIRFFARALRGLSVGLLVTDPLRAIHLRQGHVIACVSPVAAAYYRRICRIYGGGDLAKRVTVIPHAVESRFRYSEDTEKGRQIVCVGRWQDAVQKRAWLLMDVVKKLTEEDPDVSFSIAGDPTPEMVKWHESLNPEIAKRVLLEGRVDRDRLLSILRQSCIFYSPSSFESFGIAAAEALCCGCSVVSGRSVSMASFEWFAEQDGRLAVPDTLGSHISTLREELACWDNSMRSAGEISTRWSERLHAGNVAERIAGLLQDSETKA